VSRTADWVLGTALAIGLVLLATSCAKHPVECGRVKRTVHSESGCLGQCNAVAIDLGSRVVTVMGWGYAEGDQVCVRDNWEYGLQITGDKP